MSPRDDPPGRGWSGRFGREPRPDGLPHDLFDDYGDDAGASERAREPRPTGTRHPPRTPGPDQPSRPSPHPDGLPADLFDDEDTAHGPAPENQDAGPDATYRLRRRPSSAVAASAAALVLPAAAAVTIVAPIAWYANLYAGAPAALAVIAAWILPGMLLFVRPLQPAVARRWFHLREPTEEERQRIEGPWTSVLRRAQIPARRYRFPWVQDSDAVNAMAGGSSVVAVTSHAATRLEDRHLEAILAHELGHHANLHTLALTAHLVVWLPIRIVRRIARLAWRSTRAVARLLRWWRWWLTTFLALLVLAAGAMTFGLLMLPALVALAGTGLARIVHDQAEHEADYAAVRLGLGPELLEVLEGFIRDGQNTAPERYEKLLLLQPLNVRRATRVRRLLAVRESA